MVFEVASLFGFFFGYVFTTETVLEKKLDKMKNTSVSEINEQIEPFSNSSYEDFFLGENVMDDSRGSDGNE